MTQQDITCALDPPPSTVTDIQAQRYPRFPPARNSIPLYCPRSPNPDILNSSLCPKQAAKQSRTPQFEGTLPSLPVLSGIPYPAVRGNPPFPARPERYPVPCSTRAASRAASSSAGESRPARRSRRSWRYTWYRVSSSCSRSGQPG